LGILGDVMDTMNQLMMGFAVIFEPMNLFYCFMGCLIGTLVGVLPGIGPSGAMAILLPVTFQSTPVQAIIILSGIWYGSQYGGSTTSILINMPGEAGSVITCLDGHKMAQKGMAGPALGIAAFGSFIAGTFGILGLMFMAPALVNFALKFGPPEYFSLMCLGMSILAFLTSTSIVRAIMVISFGIIVGTIGTDPISGSTRFTFDIMALLDGVGIVPFVMGLFGISEVLLNVEKKIEQRSIFKASVKGLLPSFEDWMKCKGAIIRGSVIGFLLGILPGGGVVLASFISYSVEKIVSKHPQLFGTGVIEGVAAPESANNAAAQGSFIPLLTLGIPANPIMAILLGALLIHGVTPGPLLLVNHPDVFWGVVASMYVGNIMLLVLNLPLIGLWVRVLKVPFSILTPIIIIFCLIGAYVLNGTSTDITIMLIFGLIGYLFKKMNYEIPPMVLAFVLGPMLEYYLKQSLIYSSGSFAIFITRPISAVCLILSIILLSLPLLPWFQRKRLGLISQAEKAVDG
jgi:putative tricarboxylic transport membrane protein